MDSSAAFGSAAQRGACELHFLPSLLLLIFALAPVTQELGRLPARNLLILQS